MMMMMKVRRRLTGMMAALLLGAASVGTAYAECPAAYTSDQLTEDLGAMTQSLRDLDEATFRATGNRMEANLPCIRAQLPAQVYASVYRYIGAAHYLEKDYQVAGRWFRTALELDPTFEWDVNDLGPGHPLRGHFDAQRATAAAEAERIEGMDLLVPAGATLLLDGRPLKVPAATGGRPHLLQVVSTSDREVRQAFLIEGAALPEAFLQPAVVASTQTTNDGRGRKSGRSNEQILDEIAYGDIRVVQIQRVRPPAKTPLMVAGGAGLLIGGGLYAASYATHARFDGASTTTDLLRYQSMTNSLVIASGAMVAVSVGVGYAGVMMDGGQPGVFFGGRF